jgi:hypothetical protein
VAGEGEDIGDNCPLYTRIRSLLSRRVRAQENVRDVGTARVPG